MDLDAYQKAAERTYDPSLDQDQGLALVGLGVAGEAGEVADEIKKVLFHGRALNRDDLVKELGDVLWYVAIGARVLGTTLETIAHANITKLAKRYPGGFPGGGFAAAASAPSLNDLAPGEAAPRVVVTPGAPTPAEAVGAQPPAATPTPAPPAPTSAPPGTKPGAATGEVLVRTKADIPRFATPDGREMTLKAGDLAHVPASVASLLVKRGKANLVEAAV